MPHVPVMIQELVHSLPPLGEAKVCDLLGRNIQHLICPTYSTIQQLVAGHWQWRWRNPIQDVRCQLWRSVRTGSVHSLVTYQPIVFVQRFRIEQCKSKLKLVNNNFDLHSVFNTEVGFFHYSIIVIITIVSSDWQREYCYTRRTIWCHSCYPCSAYTCWA